MGVAGSGKTSIGKALAARLGAPYKDADIFHPQANIDKMAAGHSLSDEDRWPWLSALCDDLKITQGLVIAGCSALKRAYRDFITKTVGEPVKFIYLNGSKDLICNRMTSRKGHFMPTSLLNSQFETLEIPDLNENAISVDISGTEQQVLDSIISQLNNPSRRTA